jgi:ribosomal protein S18 acetylase RimI-like enzyme
MAKARHVASRLAVGVEKSHQKRGVAKAIFSEAEKIWQLMNICRVEFTVITENQPAINLYLKLGYQIEGERKHSALKADGGFYDEYYMAKIL